VCVLAATSRPDLLDAALLRPGRLDRLIYCGFPNVSERGQVLHALARRLRLDAAVDLDDIGQRCEGYSGADLSALLSEAQLAAVHERLDLTNEQTTTPEVLVQLNFHPLYTLLMIQAVHQALQINACVCLKQLHEHASGHAW